MLVNQLHGVLVMLCAPWDERSKVWLPTDTNKITVTETESVQLHEEKYVSLALDLFHKATVVNKSQIDSLPSIPSVLQLHWSLSASLLIANIKGISRISSHSIDHDNGSNNIVTNYSGLFE